MNAERRLGRSGLRATPIRLRVLDAVVNAPGALAPAEILDRVQERGEADRVSVYRALDALVEHRLVVRTSGPDRTFRYCSGNADAHTHSHFYCTGCGAMLCLPPETFAVDESLLPEGAAVQRVEVRVEGLCAACRAGR